MIAALSGFDPLVRDWFLGRFSLATEPQTEGWPEIRAGRDVLISAPMDGEPRLPFKFYI